MKKLVDLIGTIEEGQVACYLDEHEILHATERKDYAMKYAVGKILITDECEAQNGYPVINGEKVKVYGAGEDWVYLTRYAKDNDQRYYFFEDTLKVGAGESVTVSHADLTGKQKKAYRIANELYLALK